MFCCVISDFVDVFEIRTILFANKIAKRSLIAKKQMTLKNVENFFFRKRKCRAKGGGAIRKMGPRAEPQKNNNFLLIITGNMVKQLSELSIKLRKGINYL